MDDNPQETVDSRPSVSAATPTSDAAPSDSVPDFRARRNLNRFEILGVLGEGGMGIVYRAWDPQLGREVALKLLRRDSPSLKARLLREARSQARIEHPGVCRIYEAGELDGEPYIAMQRIAGHPLSEMAARLNIQQKAEIGRQVAEALHAAHREGLIHRDVKPANILVEQLDDNSLRAYVTDFGLVRDLGEEGHTQSGVILGTWSYMAPEQLRGEVASIDRRTDVYGLGATLYELLTGRPPYGSLDPGTLAIAMANEELPSPRQVNTAIPVDLEAVVLKCLEAVPERRYPSARAVAEDLGRYLDGMPVLARRAGILTRPWRWVRRHRWPVTAAALCLLLLMGFGLVRAWDMRRLRQVGEAAERYITLLGGVELKLMYAYMQPAHDVTSQLAEARRLLGNIEQAMQREGEVARGPGNYVLGRGELLLGNPEEAVRRLRMAWAAGYQRPEAAYSLARALLAVQERQRMQAQSLPDPLARQARLAEIDRTYGSEITVYLRAVQTAEEKNPMTTSRTAKIGEDAIPVAVLQAAHAGRFEEAAGMLARVQEKLRWEIEGQVLQIRLETQRADAARERGAYDEARQGYDRARTLLAQTAGKGASYPARHEAACALATSVLTLATMQNIEAKPAYRDALAAAHAYLAVTPDAAQAERFRRQAWLLYAYWRFSNGFYAKEELDAVDAEVRLAMARDPRDVDALRDLATSWRYRAFALRDVVGSTTISRANDELAAQRIAEINEQIRSLQPLRAEDWHNLGAIRRLLADPINETESEEVWKPPFRMADLTLRAALEVNEQFAPAHKDLGYIYYIAAQREMAHDRDPDAALEKSLIHSRWAVKLVPGYFDAWDNLAAALGLMGNAKASRGDEPISDFQAAEQAWNNDISANSARPYAYFRSLELCFLPWARFEVLRGGNWDAILARGEALVHSLVDTEPGGHFSGASYAFLCDLYLLRAHLEVVSGRNPLGEFQTLRSLLSEMQKQDSFKSLLRGAEVRFALHARGKLSPSEVGALRDMYAWSFAAQQYYCSLLDFPGGFADLVAYLADSGVSPEPDLQRLDTYLGNMRGNYLYRAEVKLAEGRIALIRAEWLHRTTRFASYPEDSSLQPGVNFAKDPGALASTSNSATAATGPKAANGATVRERIADGGQMASISVPWQDLARHSKELLDEAVRLNRWLERTAAPFQARASRLLSQ